MPIERDILTIAVVAAIAIGIILVAMAIITGCCCVFIRKKRKEKTAKISSHKGDYDEPHYEEIHSNQRDLQVDLLTEPNLCYGTKSSIDNTTNQISSTNGNDTLNKTSLTLDITVGVEDDYI